MTGAVEEIARRHAIKILRDWQLSATPAPCFTLETADKLVDAIAAALTAERQRADEAERVSEQRHWALVEARDRIAELQAFIGEPGQLTYEQLARELIAAEARVAALERELAARR